MLPRDKLAGFTLIELMLVILIIAILAAIGYPNYQEQVLKGHRAEAKNAIMLLSAKQQRYYSDYGYYAGMEQLTDAHDMSKDAQHHILTISCTPDCTASARPQQYLITATPTGTDLRCGSYLYNQAGVLASNGTADNKYC